MTDITESEVNGDSAAEPAPEKKRKVGKLVIFGAVGVALLLAAGGATFFLMQSNSAPVDAAVAQPVAVPTFFYDLPEITVNLNTGGGAAEFLKLSISLEVTEESMMSTIEPRMPRVLDAFQVYLRELRRADLEGSAGIYRLKEELHRRVNLAVYPASVENILFKEILIQ